MDTPDAPNPPPQPTADPTYPVDPRQSVLRLLQESGDGGGHHGAAPSVDPLTAAGIPPGVEPGWMDWVGEIPSQLARRIACDCDVWRIVLAPTTGLPPDVGRAYARVHEGQWGIQFDHTTGQVSLTRPDGRPHELAPSQPFTGSNTPRLPNAA